VGFAEGSRGCKHWCRHCPVVPVYQGKFRIVQASVVLADIRSQVAMGAEHISFGDPDFLNGPTHALKLARALHAEFPDLTFDATIKVQHLIEQMDTRRQELHTAQAKELGSGMTAVELQFELLCDAELLRHRRELGQELARLQQLQEQQREIFQQSRRARQTLETMRDQQLRLYQKEAVRREQRTLDDLFLVRREYLRRS